MFMRLVIAAFLLLGAFAAQAAPFAHGRGDGRDFMRTPQRNLLGNSGHAPRVGNQQAAAQVRHAYANYKILSLQLMDNAKGSPIYRVKALSPDGVVKYIYVDAVSGDVFE